MRSDIGPAAIFPDYELSDHTAKRGSSPSCKASIPWSSSSAAAVSAPRTADRLKGLLNSTARWRLAPIAGLSRSAPTTLTETNEYRSGIGAHWPFLSDTRRIVQKDLDIAEYTDPAP